MLATGCPGLLIYGRRRMGKSTLLKNLDGFLPGSIGIISISMENPLAFSSLSSLIGLITEKITGAAPEWRLLAQSGAALATQSGARFVPQSWQPEAREDATDLSSLFRCLEAANAALLDQDRRLILAFDEFEQFDIKLGEGTFNLDLLSTIRESVQTHRCLIWTFAGSHHISELAHAPWTSYFVSLRTIEVPPFTPAETRLLLTEPLKESPLYERQDASRPRLDAEFWGEGGIDFIHAEADGWPHLVQLLAGTAVDLVNEATASRLDPLTLERAADRAIVDGDTVLRELMHGESRLPGEWDYLAGFRTRDALPPPADELIFQSLRRRQIVVDDGGAWRLRVPLMQRWLRRRG